MMMIRDDLGRLAHIMVDLVLSKATETLDYIRSLLKQEQDPELEKSFAYYAELYIPVVKNSLPQANAATKTSLISQTNLLLL
ncbi:hypothetical protein L484_026153 [Morus notabilis]|uniref:Uncharacterized protein n=1 Tax=Morus notabilis TaxID=981085 RepID=W9RIR3_9ROSA|nr:hypothetical protein L484_026153 [Morus notabilis]